MKNMKDIFDLSYLKLIYDRISLGYESLHTLYKDLGTKHTRVRKFEKLMISNSSKRIAIDGHVISCTSECNDLSEFGYKSKKLGRAQINWLTAVEMPPRIRSMETPPRIRSAAGRLFHKKSLRDGKGCGRTPFL